MQDRDEQNRARARDRLHILDGLVSALGQWDNISSAVAECPNRKAAGEVLGQAPFMFSGAQVQHILDLTLSRRTLEGREWIEAEAAQLRDILGPDDETGEA
jgi:DNA gyrase subunit A